MLPLPQFPSKSPGGKWGISKCMPPAPGKKSPCTSLPGTRTALEHPFHHLPRQGVPGYPLEQRIHPLPSILSAEGSSTRVPSLTSAAAPRSYSTPPVSFPLVSLPEHRDPQPCSRSDFPGAGFPARVSQQELPPGSPPRPRPRTSLKAGRERRGRGGSSGCSSGCSPECSRGNESRRAAETQTFIFRFRHRFPRKSWAVPQERNRIE